MMDMDDIFKSRLGNQEVQVPDDMWSRIQSSQKVGDVAKSRSAWKLLVVFGTAFIVSVFSLVLIDSDSSNTLAEVVPFQESSQENPLAAKQMVNNNLSDLLLAKNELLSNSSEIAKISASEEFHIPVANNVDQNLASSGTEPSSFFTNQAADLSKNDVIHEQVNDNSSIKSEIIASPKVVSSSDTHLQNIKITEFILHESPLKVNLQMPDYDSKCPKFGKSSTGYFSIEAYHSSDFNFKNLVAKNEEYDSYAQLRKETETARYSYTDGLKFRWHNNSGLALGVGVERSRINERFQYVDPDAREVKVLISIDTLFMQDGSFTTSVDTTRIELLGVKTNSIANSYTSIDLPFSIGYQFELNRWAIGIHGGVNINLLFSQDGRILGLDNKPAWISTGSENELDIFQAKSGLKFDATISLVYHLTSNLDILVEPHIRYNTNTLTRDNYKLDQFYNTFGLRTGVRYNFGF